MVKPRQVSILLAIYPTANALYLLFHYSSISVVIPDVLQMSVNYAQFLTSGGTWKSVNDCHPNLNQLKI